MVVRHVLVFLPAAVYEAKDSYHEDLSRLLRSLRLSNVVIIATDFNTPSIYLGERERHIRALFSPIRSQ